MIDKKLQKRLREWLESPSDSRNIEEGATILLKINRNVLMYRNAVRFPHKYASHVEYQLKKYYNKNVQEITHEQVEEMARKVDRIESAHLALQEDNPASEFVAGKRADHDTLPLEIQSLYVENKTLVQRMREVHVRLRILTNQPGICPDSDRYPFLKELIELDKQLHENWARYDAYDTNKAEDEQEESILDAREAAKRAMGFINLNKKRYRENPTPELKAKLSEAYAKVINPKEKMTAELKELGIIENDNYESKTE